MGEPIFRWRPLTTALLLGGLVVVLLASTVSYVVTSFQPKTEVILGTQPYRMVVADDFVSREKGLSGKERLGKDEGLLMVFEDEDRHGIWMKDMLIPIDILWLDSNQKIIHIVQDAKPEMSTDVTFSPRKPARYVIEVASGTVKQHGLKNGQFVDFNHEVTSLWW